MNGLDWSIEPSVHETFKYCKGPEMIEMDLQELKTSLTDKRHSLQQNAICQMNGIDLGQKHFFNIFVWNSIIPNKNIKKNCLAPVA